MQAIIIRERPDHPDAALLITELQTHLEAFYPPESRHGFSIEKLIAEDVPFFLLRTNSIPVACGGVKLFGSTYAEVKRMYVRPQFRGRGFARMLLEHLETYARQHTINLLRLETGIHQVAAIRLYEYMGFRLIPPFGAYTDDPLSRCYEKIIA